MTTIPFEVVTSGDTHIAVYDILGREVATLVDREMASGMHQVTWDGRDHSGRSVPSGMYLYRLAVNGQVSTRRMTLIK